MRRRWLAVRYRLGAQTVLAETWTRWGARRVIARDVRRWSTDPYLDGLAAHWYPARYVGPLDLGEEVTG
jgi:hypothetical protein